ncbi:PEP-CTERM sorting domain-containing protein [Massilia sp. Root335]|uniref:PEP-CTERM sorting domain-containing protein n=1 Tax=Massilia sp. Root335 TaxID=1736517 RepID=UPI0006F4829E|nr:PEP-CTERM sorting domain-containing protein [Massilia sp. Root335]KQV33785.1 hypothetical protein ASC93_25420 [Massilia sp. Root335]
MDYRTAYIRRSRKGSRLKKRVAAIGLLGAAACAVVFALEMRETAAPPAAPVQAQAPADAATPAPVVLRTAAQAETKKTRRVYPYSIVPGGVIDRRELAHAVVADKVVAAHYAAFDTARATVETVGKPRAVYVSYRKGDKVFWTSKKLQLAEGETLLTDGRNEIRTRCGNRISDVPQLPVEAKGPSEEELDSSVEQAQEGGNVEQVGFALDGNPAGGSYQLKTFATGDTASTGGTSATSSETAVPGYRINRDAILDGGTLPVTQDSKSSSDTTGTGTDTGGSGTGTSGTGGVGGTGTGGSGTGSGDPGTGGTSTGGTSGTTPGGTTSGGTQTPTDTGTNPSSPPGTLLPPTTDLPGQTNDPGKTPVKHADVPEPGTLWLGGAGVVALLAARRARTRARK